MSNTFEPFKTKKYIAIAKEPVYVGTGGYRIGRVDNTIIRDPSTNLPKIPGSTISGNARYYSWLFYRSKGKDKITLGCAKGKSTLDERENKQEACGNCPICLSYGYINSEKAQSGLAYFSDARILFFPVSTMVGTVWVTSDEIVKEFIDLGDSINLSNKEKFFISSEFESSLPEDKNGNKILNFGWIMLEKEDESKDFTSWTLKKNDSEEVYDLKNLMNEIDKKICIVSQEIFHQIVNSNLETRTSVSINPITGAAEGGALFTYEALPRGTVFIFDVTYENPKNYGKDEYGDKDGLNIVIETVEKGFELFSSLGIGGMGTRGFGKVQIKKDNFLKEKEYWESVKSYLENLESKATQLKDDINQKQSELETISDKSEKQNKEKGIKKLCKNLDRLNDILNLWKSHLKFQKEMLKEKIDNSQETYNTISAINIETPEKCKEEDKGE